MTGVEVAPDGTVWTSFEGTSASAGRIAPCMNGPGGGGLAVARLVDGKWQEVADGVDHPGSFGRWRRPFAVGPDGRAVARCLVLTAPARGIAGVGCRCMTQTAGWKYLPSEAVRGMPPGRSPSVRMGPSSGIRDHRRPRLRTWSGAVQGRGLARPSISPIVSREIVRGTGDAGEADMAVSPDGHLWAAFHGDQAVAEYHRDWGIEAPFTAADAQCGGVLSFDGTSWAQHLAGAVLLPATSRSLPTAPSGQSVESFG